MTRNSLAAMLALVMTLVVSVAYLLLGVLQIRPYSTSYRVTVELTNTGGLLPERDVTLHGVRIGTVESVRLSANGVNAVLRLDGDTRIPADTRVRVSALSAAGEQYVDFTATSETGPYLSDGAVIASGHTNTPVPISDLLENADGLLAQVDPAKVERIKHELSLSSAAPEKLTAIVNGGVFLLSALDSVLPETIGIISNARPVSTMAVDVNAGIAATADHLGHTLRGISAMRDGYGRLIDQSPGVLGTIDGLFEDNSDTMVQLLGNLATVAQLSYVRVPALNALFPDHRGSALEAFTGTMHDHGLWVTADLYPRYSCDYGTPRRPPSSADYPEPFLYTYCFDDDPSVLVRGARNAPRPAGDDTAGPPPGADLAATADPTPKGRYTIPTPYGGPTLPIEPPG